ncbi:hypothetical protein IscW_ISCW011976 [Ixodes scapularis]|uniref:Uncharacterized protein n=1 Tax=Ixodes scapularis TaxID=6945 RepID=B7QE36_IXOSC|nr:hypothetical protein IscW_ISCW011976 [Ixodes scapularis]|eukprot:XP_002413800.1 hypothetical protein IscW_ISCW011976 [Ixodes scapularis]
MNDSTLLEEWRTTTTFKGLGFHPNQLLKIHCCMTVRLGCRSEESLLGLWLSGRSSRLVKHENLWFVK